MTLKKPQKSLKKWTKQNWRTKSGKPSTQGSKATGERYLPEKAIKARESATLSGFAWSGYAMHTQSIADIRYSLPPLQKTVRPHCIIWKERLPATRHAVQ